MSRALISQKTAISLENLMGLFFTLNRLLDRAQAQLSVKFVMPKTSNIVHIHWSHIMPLVADKISDYCDDRNYAVNYPATTQDYTNYNNLMEMFTKILDYMIEIEGTVAECVDLAEEENDIMTKHFLEKFLVKEVKPYTKMALAFVDYIERNGDTPKDHMDMDDRINKFLGIEGD